METYDDFFKEDVQRNELTSLPDVEIIDLVEKNAETYRVTQFINASQSKEYDENILLSEAVSRAIVHTSEKDFQQQVLLHFNDEQKTAIITVCSFLVVKGRPKTGKTTALVWIIAALLGCPDLPYVGSMPAIDHVLWADTEQSRVHIALIRNRVGRLMSGELSWNSRLTLVSLRPYSPHARLRLIEHLVQINSTVRVLVIDNIADLTISILDDVEAGELMRRLFRLIESRKLLVVSVLHTNKTNTHSRGHLGSLADQRAEVLLNVESRDGVMRVEAELTRNSPIPAVEYMITNGDFQFLKDTDAILSKPMKSKFDQISIEVHRAIVAEIFEEQQQLKPGDFQKRLKDVYAKRIGEIGIELRKQLQRFYVDQNLIHKKEGKLKMTE